MQVQQEQGLQQQVHQMRDDLQQAQQLLCETGGLAAQQAEANQQLQQQVQQVRATSGGSARCVACCLFNALHAICTAAVPQVQAELLAKEIQASQEAASAALASRALCRRMLHALQAAAVASAAWRAVKARAQQQGQLALQRRALHGWAAGARRCRQAEVLRVRQQRRLLRRALQGWQQGVLVQRCVACALRGQLACTAGRV